MVRGSIQCRTIADYTNDSGQLSRRMLHLLYQKKKKNKFHISFFPYLPTNDLFIAIFSIESRFHLTTGVGLPLALQRSVTFDPSRTIKSLELNESSIFGGTIVESSEIVIGV